MGILELFNHPGCISKRESSGMIRQVLKHFPNLSFREVNLFRDKSRAHFLGVRMSPTLVLDGEIISVGIPTQEKLEALLKAKKKKVYTIRNRSKYGALAVAIFLLSGTSAFSSLAFDHRHPDWQEFLKRYVQTGRADYQAIKKSPHLLETYVKSIESVSENEYKQWSRNQKIAFWANAYNAAVIKTIIDHYPLKKRAIWKAFTFPSNSIQQIPNVWSRPMLEVFGEKISLNHIEHEILRMEFKEPRIHFALVCASLGCPILRSEPYIADNLDFQLNDQISRFLADPKKFRYDADTDTVRLSPIFNRTAQLRLEFE